jgi:hypothetical protein
MSMHSIKAHRTLRRLGVAALMATGAVVVPSVVVPAVVVPAVGAAPVVSAVTCTSYCGGGEFHPVPLARIVDTASGLNDVAPLGSKPIGPSAHSFDIPVLGHGALPPTSVAPLAEVLTIIVANPTVSGTLSVWGAGDPPSQPSVTFTAHQTTATTVIVHAAFAGRVRILMRSSANGSARILIDQVGWYSTSVYNGAYTGGDPRGWRTIPIAAPVRVFDTRNGAAADTPMAANVDVAIAIRGARPIGGALAVVPPDATVVGAVLAVTAWSATSLTHLTVLPDPVSAPAPPVVQVYTAPGQVRSNLVIVPVGADGKVHLFNSAGRTNVTVDVLAYLRSPGAETTRVGRVVPLAASFRAFDTRQPAFGKVPLGPGQSEDWSFAAFASSVKISGTWVGKQVAFLGTLTNASLTRQYPTRPVGVGSLTMYPASQARPNAATLVTRERGVSSTPVLVRYGANQVVRVFNQAGYAHYLLDVGAVVLAD